MNRKVLIPSLLLCSLLLGACGSKQADTSKNDKPKTEKVVKHKKAIKHKKKSDPKKKDNANKKEVAAQSQQPQTQQVDQTQTNQQAQYNQQQAQTNQQPTQQQTTQQPQQSQNQVPAELDDPNSAENIAAHQKGGMLYGAPDDMTEGDYIRAENEPNAKWRAEHGYTD